MLKNSGNYFREYLLSDEDVARMHAEYVTKLRQQYLAMGLERLFVDEIQDHLQFKLKDVDREVSKRRLKHILENEDKDIIMQKYAYLSFLVNNDIVAYSMLNLHYFKQTIFAPLFEGLSAAEIGNQFLEIEMEPREHFYSLVNEQIDKLPKYLPHPMQRLRKTSHAELVEKTVKALKMGRPPKTVFDAKGEEYQLKLATEMVAAKVLKTINDRMAAGESQQQVLMALKAFQMGTLTEECNDVLAELIVEAVVDTDLIKLPPVFKEKMNLFTHLHKRKVADSIVNHVTNKILALGGSQIASGLEEDDAKRKAIPVTPEIVEKLKSVKNMSMEQIAEDAELFRLVQSRAVGINLEKRSTELLQSESDAKLHRIVFNPNNEHIPVDLTSMSQQELEANNITVFKACELEVDGSGRLVKAKTNDQKLMTFFSKVESLYEKQKGDKPTEQVIEKPEIVYNDEEEK